MLVPIGTQADRTTPIVRPILVSTEFDNGRSASRSQPVGTLGWYRPWSRRLNRLRLLQ